MQYFAGQGRIATREFDGAIEITEAQYLEALDGITQGKSVSIEGGFSVAFPAEPEPEPVPDPTPEEIRAAQIVAIDEERDRRIQELASQYTQTERETWPVQVDEAKAFKSEPKTPTPMLTPLANARGITVDEMADRVLSIAATTAAATGEIMGAATKIKSMDPIPDDVTQEDLWSIK